MADLSRPRLTENLIHLDMKKLFYAELLDYIEPLDQDVVISDSAMFLVSDEPSKYPYLEFVPVNEEAFKAYKDQLQGLL